MIQIVELLFNRKPVIDFMAVKARAEQILGRELEASSLEKAGNMLVLFHKDFCVEYADGELPAQTAISHVAGRP